MRPSFEALRDPYAAEIAYADAQLARLLEFIVMEALENRADDLKQYAIATRALGRRGS